MVTPRHRQRLRSMRDAILRGELRAGGRRDISRRRQYNVSLRGGAKSVLSRALAPYGPPPAPAPAPAPAAPPAPAPAAAAAPSDHRLPRFLVRTLWFLSHLPLSTAESPKGFSQTRADDSKTASLETLAKNLKQAMKKSGLETKTEFANLYKSLSYQHASQRTEPHSRDGVK